MEDRVEKGAKALHRTNGENPSTGAIPWELVPPKLKTVYRAMAKVVIDSLSEPDAN